MNKNNKQLTRLGLKLLLGWLGLIMSAQAFDGVIEIRGQIVAASCDTSAIRHNNGQWPSSVNGQDCQLTSNPLNPLATSAVAIVGEETIRTAHASAPLKRTVTLTYR